LIASVRQTWQKFLQMFRQLRMRYHEEQFDRSVHGFER
jgi:hypothetical protein